MKVIEEGFGYRKPWWVGMRMECHCCGRVVELEQNDSQLPNWIPAPANTVSIRCWCGYVVSWFGISRCTAPRPCAGPVAEQPLRHVSKLYDELLYAVARKFPGESRHETALRYIREAEKRPAEALGAKESKGPG